MDGLPVPAEILMVAEERSPPGNQRASDRPGTRHGGS